MKLIGRLKWYHVDLLSFLKKHSYHKTLKVFFVSLFFGVLFRFVWKIYYLVVVVVVVLLNISFFLFLFSD
jgi:hypothetical protein